MRFEHAPILWLLPVLPTLVFLFLWWSNRVRKRLLNRFVQARLLPELTVGLSTARQRFRAVLFALSMALIILALARPQWGFTWEEARQKGLDIVVAIDTSKSMLAEDIKPNRLERAKLAALDLMQQARADRLAVVAFAGRAFLQCPLTFDDAAFRQCIDELNVNVIPQGGTALAEAIAVTLRAFQDDDNFKVLVLLTDGEDHDPGALQAANEAAEAGMRIFTVGLGTKAGELLRIRDDNGRVDYVRDRDGQVVKSRLNETILQQIAEAAQGFYLPLQGADTVETLYEKGLAPLPKSESEARLFQRYHEQYHWPLGLALLLLLVEAILPERKRESRVSTKSAVQSATTTAAILLLLSPSLALASPGRAAREFKSGDYAGALEEYDRLRAERGEDPRLHYNAGTAAFRAERYKEAVDRYTMATGARDLNLQQKAYYNLGNSLYRVGEQQSDLRAKREAWEQAVKDYESALKLNAEDPDARFNLEFVKKRLEELDQQQQQDNQQDKNQDPSKDEQDDQRQQDQQSGQDQSQDQQKESQQEPTDSSQRDQPQDERNKQEAQPQKEPGQNEGEQQSEQSQQAQASAPSDAQNEPQQNPENAQGQPTQPSNLTPEQAAQLLDNLRGEEQMLPIRLMSPQPTQPPAKDW